MCVERVGEWWRDRVSDSDSGSELVVVVVVVSGNERKGVMMIVEVIVVGVRGCEKE